VYDDDDDDDDVTSIVRSWFFLCLFVGANADFWIRFVKAATQ